MVRKAALISAVAGLLPIVLPAAASLFATARVVVSRETASGESCLSSDQSQYCCAADSAAPPLLACSLAAAFMVADEREWASSCRPKPAARQPFLHSKNLLSACRAMHCTLCGLNDLLRIGRTE
jgi:hypothetical protein